MGSDFGGFFNGSPSVNGGTLYPGLTEPLNYTYLFDYNEQLSVNTNLPDPPSPPFPSVANNVCTSPVPSVGAVASPTDSGSDGVLKYINQMLMEEDLDSSPYMYFDSAALQEAEKPFYDALVENPPPPPDPDLVIDHPVVSPTDHFSGFSSEHIYFNGNSSPVTLANPTWVANANGTKRSFNQPLTAPPPPPPAVPYSIQPPAVSSWTFNTSNSRVSTNDSANNGLFGSFPTLGGMDIYRDTESVKLFQKGMDEASKFLPKSTNLVVNLDNMTFPDEPRAASCVVVKRELDDYSPDDSRGRKIHYLDDEDLEDGRSSKQCAVLAEEEAAELSEMFDRVLLSGPGNLSAPSSKDQILPKEEAYSFGKYGQSLRYDSGGGYYKRQIGSNQDSVDVRPLLLLCAQAAATDDHKTATELIRQIRQYSSPLGNGSQRLAHYFANALEARLAGTGPQMFKALNSKTMTAAQILKGYQGFVSICPYKKVPILFANDTIMKLAENRPKLHIIDFGILYGFQWPMLIQRLSEREGGPPKLHITGIELPQPGFRPAVRVEATGRRLAKYCERFKVPFEYHAIAQKWETIKLEDLKIGSDEVVAVNCLYRFRHLLDETIVVDSPRDTVLNLIRRINPDVFVHGIISGSHKAPFFITRFREAIYHYSTMFDLFDCTSESREDPDRALFEQEFFGREIMNVVACEGTERIERPETYKQWQVRNTNAGLKQLPLNPEIVNKLKHKIKACYHKDYFIDVDGNWTLLGWKGRIGFGVSAWVPA